MRISFVLLFIGAAVLAAVGGSSLHREVRQTFNFPDEPSSSESLPARPTGTSTSRPTAPPAPTPQPQQPGSNSTLPPGGVIFQVPNCPCPAPPQYNPVCGTDGNTYVNRQKLMCARQCGYSVEEARMGAC